MSTASGGHIIMVFVFLFIGLYFFCKTNKREILTLRATIDALTQRLDLHQGTACPVCGARGEGEVAMPQVTDRELKLSKLLDEVLCLYAFATNRQFDEMGGAITQVYREIATTRKLAEAAGIEYPITLLLANYLRKEGLL